MAKIWERDFLLQPPILDLDDEDEFEDTESVEAQRCVSAQLLKLEQLGIKTKKTKNKTEIKKAETHYELYIVGTDI